MASPIQFSGLASGLDTSAIIQALLGVEQLGINRLEDRKAVENSRLSLIGTLEGLVQDLRDKAEELSGDGDVFQYGMTNSDESVATITTTGTVTPGLHTLEVTQLAQIGVINSTGVTDPDNELVTGPGDGEIEFDVDGTTYTFDIEDGSGSLNQIASQINDEAGDVVSARVVNTGTESSPSYELVIESLESGKDHDISNMSASGLNGGVFSFTDTQDGQDAIIKLDNLTINRASNSFSDVLPGYSFTLLSETDPGEPITFGAELDAEATIEELKGFVDSYNEVVSFIAGQSTYDEEAGAGGLLFGDGILSTVKSNMYNGLFSVPIADVIADTSGFATLGQVGFDVQADGTIQLDETLLGDKLAEDPEAFTELLSGEREYPAGSGEMVDGFLGQLAASLDSLLDDSTDINGNALPDLFEGRKDAIGARVDALDDSISREETRLESYETFLTNKFASLESLMAGLQSQQSFLGSF